MVTLTVAGQKDAVVSLGEALECASRNVRGQQMC